MTAAGQPQTIDEILEALDGVIDRCRHDPVNRVGYFAALYRKVTAKVKEGIGEGFFDDGPRMARLDVAFANRYLTALDAYQGGRRPTKSWAVAFDATRSPRYIVLQHLLAGINSHINLDLGIAAAEVAPNAALPGLRGDFDRINEVLASLLEQVQQEMARISPWLGLLDAVGGRSDDEIARFSIEVARTEAWHFARELAPLDRAHWGGPIGLRDQRIARLAGVVLRPGPLEVGLWLIRLRESKNVGRNIEILEGVEAPDLATVQARVRQERAPERS